MQFSKEKLLLISRRTAFLLNFYRSQDLFREMLQKNRFISESMLQKIGKSNGFFHPTSILLIKIGSFNNVKRRLAESRRKFVFITYSRVTENGALQLAVFRNWTRRWSIHNESKLAHHYLDRVACVYRLTPTCYQLSVIVIIVQSYVVQIVFSLLFQTPFFYFRVYVQGRGGEGISS